MTQRNNSSFNGAKVLDQMKISSVGWVMESSQANWPHHNEQMSDREVGKMEEQSSDCTVERGRTGDTMV